jgi:ADP-ribose pyrophosphatase YjhB (NUDIX family)
VSHPELPLIPCVGAVVVDGSGRILLVRRANPPAQGRWSIPGGRVELGETAEQAVLRELLEETGLRGAVTREVGTVLREAPAGGTYVIRDFLVDVASVDGLAAGDDASAADWFPEDQLPDLDTSEGLIEALSEWGLVSPPH